MPNDDVIPVSPLWSVREVAKFLHCSLSYVYKAAERDVLPAIRIGRMLRFRPEAVRAFAISPSMVTG